MVLHGGRSEKKKAYFLNFRPALRKTQDLKTFLMLRNANINNSAPKK